MFRPTWAGATKDLIEPPAGMDSPVRDARAHPLKSGNALLTVIPDSMLGALPLFSGIEPTPSAK
jgi:hypothetical protein